MTTAAYLNKQVKATKLFTWLNIIDGLADMASDRPSSGTEETIYPCLEDDKIVPEAHANVGTFIANHLNRDDKSLTKLLHLWNKGTVMNSVKPTPI